MRRRARPATAALVTVPALLTAPLTSCADEAPADPATDPHPVTIEISVDGDTVEPSGERVDVAVGQRIELVVEADTRGEIHVHSQPEQQLEFGAGTTTLPLTIDTPGAVDVESHDPERIIVRLEVE